MSAGIPMRGHDECEVHTILRLPTGVFYAQGVKANVVFFDRKPASETPWTNKHFTLKQNRMTRKDLDEFVECYRPGDRHNRTATWSEENPEGWHLHSIICPGTPPCSPRLVKHYE